MPPLTLTIQGKQFEGLIDSGADTTCFSPQHWPPEWLTASSFDQVSGVSGSIKKVLISAYKLLWQDEDGDTGFVRSYIIPDLPVNLWGQDIMEQMGVYMLKCKNPAVVQQMLKQGYTPTKGLGKNLQGITQSLIPPLIIIGLDLDISLHCGIFSKGHCPSCTPGR